MTFGQNPVTGTQGSLPANQFPLSSVAVPGTANGDLTALEGGPASTDSNSNKTAPASMYLKDGNDVTQGAKADSAITDSTTTNTKMSFVKGLVKIFNDVWDSTNHLLHFDLKQIAGAAISPTNPMIIEPNIQTWLRNAQIYTVTTGPQAGANQTSGACLFNASSGKSALIFSVYVMNSNPGQGIFAQMQKVTSNPSYTNSITPVNNVLSSSATSGMSPSWQASASVVGTNVGSANQNSVNSMELLTSGRAFLLQNGANSGLSVFLGQGGTGGDWSITFTYAEF